MNLSAPSLLSGRLLLVTPPAMHFAAVNSIVCMAPIETYLSCYVGNNWQPAASIDGQSMKVDYLRCYQKPGWLGAAPTNTWGDARNWGPDGPPSSGEAAMLNLNVSQPVVSLPANKQFRPRTNYTDESQRPRFRHTGPAASTDRGIPLGHFCEGNDLVATQLTHQQAWRHTPFNITVNKGDAADMADPDCDGLANMMEFATGSHPDSPNISITQCLRNGNTLEFTYSRSHAAVQDGRVFVVEWTDILTLDWSANGVSHEPVSEANGIENMNVTLPVGTGCRIARLKVHHP